METGPFPELTWPQRGRLWLRLGLRLTLTALFILLVWKVLPPLLELLMPFVVALVLAWLLNPLLRVVEKKVKGRRKALSFVLVVLTIAVVGGLAGWLLYALIGQVISFLQNWQTAWDSLSAGIEVIAQLLEDLLRPLPGNAYDQLMGMGDKFTAWLGTVIPGVLTTAAGNAGSFAMSLPSLCVAVIISLMATYFITADYPRLRSAVADRVPQEFRGFFSHLRHVALDAFGGYVRAEFILSVCVFVILLVGYLLLGEPYALLLSFVLAVMDFIPIIGAGTAMVPWAVIDVARGDFRHAVALMVIWGVIVLFRRVAEPKAVGDQTGLSPIASLVSIYVGMRLGGVLGMILGPVVCLIVLNMARGGIFDNTLRDLRLAIRDISAILAGGEDGD